MIDIKIIVKEYNNLHNKKKLIILDDALDTMNAFPSRSKWSCIAMSMGYVNFIGKSDTWEKSKKQRLDGF